MQQQTILWVLSAAALMGSALRLNAGDEKNIAVLVRVFHGLSMNDVQE